ncbi:lytic murein transglycosylase [Roseospira visakhapatnamensis]|uniref:Membrane-bound lytic murein transglycosylase B n=1 Tax=Roseospira visakhapatnamensis TaxID=390880 RepID=A0A7W6W9V7_9PROT|nr:lytic murein transglycosylase [Roseospira visakhapatnamensis]MBB4265817.1 membrane-bound lytic murein transglycosylase B [Roseospira visakhapatnamensis]
MSPPTRSRPAGQPLAGRSMAIGALAVLLTLPACAQAPVPGPRPADPAATVAPAGTTSTQEAAFARWLNGVRTEAIRRGIRPTTVDRAFAGLSANPRVVELDRRQPEFTSTFWGYFGKAVSDTRVETGRAMLARHRALLERVSRQTGVPPEVLLAFWGLESNYGSNTGGFNVIEALATLAHDGRRGAFFREQLLTALEILDQGHITPEAMQGSWAGAMGQMQFMPTTFRDHAVDGTGDGRADIWTSVPDAFASAGAFLSRIGWRAGERWGRQVRLPAGYDHARSGLDQWQPLATWRALGVTRADGGPLPGGPQMSAALLMPAGHRGPTFLVYHNFRVIMRWNNSSFYALAVGHLSDRIAGQGPLIGVFNRDQTPLRRDDVEILQGLLNGLGYQAGAPDGLLGPNTRAAIKRFQAARGLPADGYADPALLARVRRAAAGLDPT